MKKYISWKKSDIDSLTSAYISGLRIKTIAHLMGRTPCSINRALDRLKIRHPRVIRHEEAQKHPCQLQPKRQYHRDPAPQQAITEKEVSLQTVITWAQNHYGIPIEGDLNQGFFKIKGIPKSPGQLVLECNRWRLANNLPLYYVHGVCS